VQHYEPVSLFGGEGSFADRQSKDEQKRTACAQAGVILIEWRYDDPISEEAVRERLRDLQLIPREPTS